MATNAHDSHGGPFVPSGPTHGMPYEPDKFDLKPILAVPVAVVVTTILAYVTTQLIFDNVFGTHLDENKVPSESAIAAEFGKKPLNDRLRSISSTDPKAEFVQPRLEAFRTKAENVRPGLSPVTAEMTTQQPLKDISNSPEYHPEDLRANRWKELSTYAKKDENTVQIPVEKAMELLIKNNLLPADPKTNKPLSEMPNWDRPKESNGGQPTTDRK